MSILNDKTLKLIQSLSSINNSMIISKNLALKADKSLQAFVSLDELNEGGEFDDFGIFSVSDFLSAVSLIPNCSIALQDKILHISNTDCEVTFNTSNTELLKDTCQGDYELLQRIKTNEKIGEFELSQETLKSIKNASNALKDLPNLQITGKDNKVKLKIKGNEKSSNTFSKYITSDKPIVTNEDFKFLIVLNNLKKIPSGDYMVYVYKSRKTESKVLILESLNIKSLEIILGVKE